MWIYILIGILIGIVVVIKLFFDKSEKGAVDLSVYQKRFLFDSVAELNFYKILIELYGNDYRIFSQVQFSHLLEPKKSLSFTEQRKYRSRVDRKSADFVICDKERVAPVLIIELDGPLHDREDRKVNDEFKNDVAKVSGLPLLRINTKNANKDFIKSEIDKVLTTLVH